MIRYVGDIRLPHESGFPLEWRDLLARVLSVRRSQLMTPFLDIGEL